MVAPSLVTVTSRPRLMLCRILSCRGKGQRGGGSGSWGGVQRGGKRASRQTGDGWRRVGGGGHGAAAGMAGVGNTAKAFRDSHAPCPWAPACS